MVACLWREDEKGASRFSVEECRSRHGVPGPGSPRRPPRGVPKLAGELILIVDDEKQVREPIAIYLQEEGYRTVIANDGAEAMIAVSQQRPDLVLTDVYMPKMN